jgi:hypothetical protein
VISIILVSFTQKGIKQSSGHIANEISLSLEVFTNVRNNFIGQDILGELYQCSRVIFRSFEFFDVLANQA